jgi:putative ABC transport system permease protein
LLRSYNNLEDQNLGIRTGNTLTAGITPGTLRLRFAPGIALVSVSDSLPPGPAGYGGRLDEIVIAQAIALGSNRDRSCRHAPGIA